MSDQVNEETADSPEVTKQQDAVDPWPDGSFRVTGKGGVETEVSGRELWDLASKQKAGQDAFAEAQRLTESMKAVHADDAKFTQIGKAMVAMKSGATREEQISFGREAMIGMGHSEEDADEYLDALYGQQSEAEPEQASAADDQGGEMNQAIGGIVNALKQVADRLDRIESKGADFSTDLNRRNKDQIKQDFFAAAEGHDEFGRFAKDSGTLGKRAKEYAWQRLLDLAENTDPGSYDESRMFRDAIAESTAFFKDTAGARSGGGNSMPDHLGGFGGAPGVDLFKRDKPVERVSAKDASYADNGALRLLQKQAAQMES